MPPHHQFSTRALTVFTKKAVDVHAVLSGLAASGGTFPGYRALGRMTCRHHGGIAKALLELKEQGLIPHSLGTGRPFWILPLPEQKVVFKVDKRVPVSVEPLPKKSCLRCRKQFTPASRGNFICPTCTEHNSNAAPMLEGVVW